MRGRPPLRPRGAGGFQALPHALADDVSLHLGEGGLDLEEGAARGRGGVHRRVQRAEGDAALSELVDQGDELAGQAAEPIEVENDEDVAAAQVIEAGLEPGPIGLGARGAVLEDALASGLGQGVELAVEDLPVLGGRHPRVADQPHRAPSILSACRGPFAARDKPTSPRCYRAEVRAGLSRRDRLWTTYSDGPAARPTTMSCLSG